MFSARLHWNLSLNPLTRLIEEKRGAGDRILDLTESNPTRAGLNYPEAAILEALASPEVLRYDPNPAGVLSAREAVAQYYEGRAKPSGILLTASTSEAYALLFKLLCDPGDEILVPRPSYPLFEFLAALESVSVARYPLLYDHGWTVDFEALEGAIHARTRAVVVVNPNNPTGSFLKRDELERLTEICARNDVAIISDEVFADYAFAADARRVSSLVDAEEVLTFSLSGLSKVSGLPQMKLGWIVVSGPEPARSDAYARLELIADTYLSVGTPVQCAAGALLGVRGGIQGEIRARTTANLARLRQRLAATPFRALDIEGGWYAVVEAPRVRSEEEWVLDLLRRENVLAQPGFFYDFDREAFLILSLLTPGAAFAEGIDRLLALGAG